MPKNAKEPLTRSHGQAAPTSPHSTIPAHHLLSHLLREAVPFNDTPHGRAAPARTVEGLVGTVIVLADSSGMDATADHMNPSSWSKRAR